MAPLSANTAFLRFARSGVPELVTIAREYVGRNVAAAQAAQTGYVPPAYNLHTTSYPSGGLPTQAAQTGYGPSPSTYHLPTTSYPSGARPTQSAFANQDQSFLGTAGGFARNGPRYQTYTTYMNNSYTQAGPSEQNFGYGMATGYGSQFQRRPAPQSFHAQTGYGTGYGSAIFNDIPDWDAPARGQGFPGSTLPQHQQHAGTAGYAQYPQHSYDTNAGSTFLHQSIEDPEPALYNHDVYSGTPRNDAHQTQYAQQGNYGYAPPTDMYTPPPPNMHDIEADFTDINDNHIDFADINDVFIDFHQSAASPHKRARAVSFGEDFGVSPRPSKRFRSSEGGDAAAPIVIDDEEITAQNDFDLLPGQKRKRDHEAVDETPEPKRHEPEVIDLTEASDEEEEEEVAEEFPEAPQGPPSFDFTFECPLPSQQVAEEPAAQASHGDAPSDPAPSPSRQSSPTTSTSSTDDSDSWDGDDKFVKDNAAQHELPGSSGGAFGAKGGDWGKDIDPFEWQEEKYYYIEHAHDYGLSLHMAAEYYLHRAFGWPNQWREEATALLPKWEAGPALTAFCKRANEEWESRRQVMVISRPKAASTPEPTDDFAEPIFRGDYWTSPEEQRREEAEKTLDDIKRRGYYLYRHELVWLGPVPAQFVSWRECWAWLKRKEQEQVERDFFTLD